MTSLPIALALSLLTASAAPQAGPDVAAILAERAHGAVLQVGTPFEGVEQAWQAPNREHDLRTYFLPEGPRVLQRSDERCGWHIGLRLTGFGRGPGALEAVAPLEPVADGAWVEYRRGALTEWYLNGPDGLEQGFTFEQRPAGEGLLELRLAVDTELTLSVAPQALHLRGAAGESLSFRDLIAVDADGRQLPARFEPDAGAGARIVVDDAGARYPLTIDPMLINTGFAMIAGGLPEDQLFGSAVEVSGDLAAVAGPGDASKTGVVHVLRRNATFGSWVVRERIVPPAGMPGDRFGASLSLRGSRLAIGAPGTDLSGADDAGQVYVYASPDQGQSWALERTLQHPSPSPGDEFGAALALRNDELRLYVGAPHQFGGAAYLFVRVVTSWPLANVISPSGLGPTDEFGSSFGYDASTSDVLIGAPGSQSDLGLIWVFADSTSTVFRQTLQASGLRPGDRFGQSLAHAGRWMIAGAPRHFVSGVGVDAGAAYVFERIAPIWVQRHELSGPDAGGLFGHDVEVCERPSGGGDGRVAIGAPLSPSNGSIFVYDVSSLAALFRGQVFGQGFGPVERFGWDVGLDGDFLAGGAPLSDSVVAPGRDTGLARFFSYDGSVWLDEREDRPRQNSVGEGLGYSVALDGVWAAAGAPWDSDAATSGGAVYLFREVAQGNWQLAQKLTAGAAGGVDQGFGESVALRGDQLVIGEPRALTSNPTSGRVHVYRRVAGLWTFEQELVASSSFVHFQFGHDLDLEGDRLIGSVRGTLSPPTFRYGAAFVFERSGNTWTQMGELFDTAATPASPFGTAVAIDGDRALVGSQLDDSAGVGAGQVRVYEHDGNSWVLAYLLRRPGGGAAEGLGSAVDLDGDVLAAAATGVDVGGITPGTVHTFSWDGASWNEEAFLVSPNAESNGNFGRSLALDGDLLAIGARHEDAVGFNGQPALEAGRSYVYQRFVAGWALLDELGFLFPDDGDQFGSSIDIAGTKIAAGLPHQGFGPAQGLVNAHTVQREVALVYCTAKVNSQGCTPAIGFSGVPSASAGSGFDVFSTQNRDGVNGTLFYGLAGPKAQPFQGGYLCVRGPYKRTGVQNSGGAGACSGQFHLDFNARIAAGSDPRLVAGQTVWCQYWSRDAASTFGSNRSDALEFTIRP